METSDLNYFKQKLETERVNLENDLKGIARINPHNPKDWEAVPAETDETTFRDEVADRLEEFDDREATVEPLERSINDVLEALKRIANNTYGNCRICGQAIERERLEINPAAETCKKHLSSDGETR